MDVNAYLDAALQRSGVGSDRQLAYRLGISQSAISSYRTGRAWPDDDVMIRIAWTATADPTRALIDLNTWRTSGSAPTFRTSTS